MRDEGLDSSVLARTKPILLAWERLSVKARALPARCRRVEITWAALGTFPT